VHLQNWPYNSNAEANKRLLESTVLPALLKDMAAHQIPVAGPVTWTLTTSPMIYKLDVTTSKAAEYLCTQVVDQQIRLLDSMGNLHFQSSFHPLGKSELRQYFTHLAITNAQDEYFQGGGQASSVMAEAGTEVSVSQLHHAGVATRGSASTAASSSGWTLTV